MQSTAGFEAARFACFLPMVFAIECPMKVLGNTFADCPNLSRRVRRQMRSRMQYAGIIRTDCFRYCRTKVHGRPFKCAVSCAAYAVRALLRHRARPCGPDDARRVESAGAGALLDREGCPACR